MTTEYDYVRVKCPFFISGDKRTIHCEGIVNGCVTSNEFKKNSLRDKHRRLYCDGDYERCGLYKALEGKYEQ